MAVMSCAALSVYVCMDGFADCFDSSFLIKDAQDDLEGERFKA